MAFSANKGEKIFLN